MPILQNSRHELFAQALASGKSACDAYSTAGYEESRSAASRLSANVSIKARVEELQARAATGVVITRQTILEEMAKIAFAPIGTEHIKTGDKRNALCDIAKLEGWIVNKSEVGAPGDFDRMTDDELDDFIAEATRGLKLSKRTEAQVAPPPRKAKAQSLN